MLTVNVKFSKPVKIPKRYRHLFFVKKVYGGKLFMVNGGINGFSSVSVNVEICFQQIVDYLHNI